MYPTRAAFFQADPAGVLFYGRVFELFHSAYAALVEAAGLDYADHFGIVSYALPVVHAEADYARPIRPGEPLLIGVTVARLGRSSVALRYAISGADGEVKATGREVHVAVDPKAFTTIPLPESVRRALAPWEEAPGV